MAPPFSQPARGATSAADRVARVLAALLIADLVRQAEGSRTSGWLPTDPSFLRYVGKFCFDYEPKGNDVGAFQVSLHGNVKVGTGNFYFVVFDDEEHHWELMREHWQDYSCDEVLAAASYYSAVAPMDVQTEWTMKVRQKIRPRFWYFTFVSCGAVFAEPVSYEIHAENMRRGMESEFGIDEEGGLQLHVIACFAFMFLGLVLRKTAMRSSGPETMRSRPLLRILLSSILCSTAGASFLALHFAVFMVNGVGLATLEFVGELFLIAAKTLMTVLMLLTAKGWALFYQPEEAVRRQLVVLLLAAIVIFSVGCEIHSHFFMDWGTTVYIYEGWSGIGILIFNVVLFGFVWRMMHDTYRYETAEQVRNFYIMISGAALVYFLCLPFTCAMSSFSDPWVRAKHVARTEFLARFTVTCILSYCLRPSRLDIMINARLEAGLESLGESRDDDELAAIERDVEDVVGEGDGVGGEAAGAGGERPPAEKRAQAKKTRIELEDEELMQESLTRENPVPWSEKHDAMLSRAME